MRNIAVVLYLYAVVLTACDTEAMADPLAAVVKTNQVVSVMKVRFKAPSLPTEPHGMILQFKVKGTIAHLASIKLVVAPERPDDVRLIYDRELLPIGKDPARNSFHNELPIWLQPDQAFELELLVSVKNSGNFSFTMTDLTDLTAPEFHAQGLPIEGSPIYAQ